ncbi:MAG: alpha/beta fold hydrolase [Notoacmeibacter sp.]|nr:alpha/beta fold hydrolase [Notoacmeibacter sp.]
MADPVILIHGAWQGSWVWQRLRPHLDKAGLVTAAIDLPGNGADGTPPETASMERYLDHLDAVLQRLGGRANLVGHSGGGVVATAFAERHAPHVRRVAYLAGMMLPPAWTFGDLLAREKAKERGLLGIGAFLEWPRPGMVSRVPAEAGASIFLNDIPHEEALALAASLTPQGENGRTIAAHWTPERFGKVQRLYVECLRDLSVVPDMQRRMQELVPGALRVTLDAGHAPHVSAPARTAAALIDFLTN